MLQFHFRVIRYNRKIEKDTQNSLTKTITDTKAIKYEIDMLSVGAADAFLIRFYDEDDKEHVILVDAGTYDDGEKVRDFVRDRYETYTIDLAICTHCDDDHFGGFVYMINDMLEHPNTSVDIQQIVINDPGLHQNEKDEKGNRSRESVKKEARSVYDCGGKNLLSLIWEASDKLGLEYNEGFSDHNYSYFDDIIKIIAPSTDYYREQALQFRNKLNPKDYLLKDDEDDAEMIPDTKNVYSKALDEAGKDGSSHNKSSIMFVFKPDDGKRFLFTGDADEDSFDHIKFENDNNEINDIYWLKVPHHGSAHNLSNKVLNWLRPKVAYISTEKYGHYLDRCVMGALRKLGTKVYTTRDGSNYWHHKGTKDRDGYSTAKPE